MSTSKRRRSRTKKTTSIDYSKILGIILVVFGVAMCFYSFDMFDNIDGLFHLTNINDLIGLWPVVIVLLGFFFVFKDYFKKSSSQKWDSN